MSSLIELFFLLLAGHFLADFALQTEYMAKYKDPQNTSEEHPWWLVMTAHCAVHALIVGVITGSLLMSIIEFFIHFYLDYSKCEGRTTYAEDQGYHILTKLYFVLMTAS